MAFWYLLLGIILCRSVANVGQSLVINSVSISPWSGHYGLDNMDWTIWSGH